jgi:4-hydroxy-tetrahydrodipicolinate synthase
MFKGCFTASVTPMRDDGSIDYDGLEQLMEFQISNGIQGIIAVGTTGESPTLLWEEHNEVIERTRSATQGRCLLVAGTGSNSTRETLAGTGHAAHVKADGVLLVDPYYNGPSSLEIRREYIEPVAQAFPDMPIIPYIIPGRTGTMMHVEDLAILAESHGNITTVKEATGDFDNMAKTRRVCGDHFTILSGDDDKTVEMMQRDDIKAAGVISVMSNVIPGPLVNMTRMLNEGDAAGAQQIAAKLQPLFGCVGVTTTEASSQGDVQCKSRNPTPVKSLMKVLGMPAGPCRQPLGKMTPRGLQVIVQAAQAVHQRDPSLLGPIGDAFGVDVEARLNDAASLAGVAYTDY